jgi:DNA-binding NtrC family response regulator
VEPVVNQRLHVLCVDDEPRVVQGLKLHLDLHYRVSLATSGVAGLEVVDRDPPAAIVSDLRMPDMDGAVFLGHARERAPAAIRLLLTGQADLDSVAAAVNQAQVFRLLVKPCRPTTLLEAIDIACREHRRLVEEQRNRRFVEGLIHLAQTPDSVPTELATALSRMGDRSGEER